MKVENHSMSHEELIKDFGQCRGKGHLYVKGEPYGKLFFFFTVISDSTFVQFRDWIGRQTLYLQILGNDIYVWDILNNKSYDTAGVKSRYSFLDILEGQHLTKFFWGLNPQIDERNHISDTKTNLDHIKISFETNPDGNPFEITKAIFQFEKQNYVEIEISQRQYGLKYSGLQKIIPSNLILN